MVHVADRRTGAIAHLPERLRCDEGPADELNCLRGVLTVPILRAAEARGRAVRTGADQVLIHWGVIEADAYLQHLAGYLGVPVMQFADGDRCHCPLARDQLPFATASGIAPMRQNGALFWTVAPRCFAARELSRRAVNEPELIARMRLSAPPRFTQFLADRAGRPLAEIAAEGLHRHSPALSAAPSLASAARRPLTRIITGVLAALALLMLMPMLLAHAGSGALSLWFIAFALLRLIGALRPRVNLPALPHLPDAELPVYTVIAALHDEAASVGPLLDAIDALDYPREKLDVIVVLEPDDWQTRAAIARRGARPHLQVLVAPAIGPTTKPKALNFALHFARGHFVAVYDAEDAPEPAQLRTALDAFRSGDDIACAQAKLCIDNLTHSWLSKMFAVEYAGQFEVLLPGLVALRMPLPLGGSSNHFRTEALREVGGWDAWNVTEDADLGFRLARFGYRSVIIESTTSEEAPIDFGGWLRQRTRWMKGWMQTWCVHMRDPRRLWREAGWRGVLALNVVLGGNILTALAYPVLAGALLVCLATWSSGALIGGRLAYLHLIALASGLLSTVGLGLIGLQRQNRLRDAGVLLLTPIYWACLSIATWRALWQFWRSRYVWEKTEHGLVRRRNTTPRFLSAMKRSDRAPYR